MSEQAGRLAGKIAVVTGGASGIGRAIAEVFAVEGASVHIVDVNGDDSHRAASELSAAGASVAAHQADVSNADDVKRAFSAIRTGGPVDILVNNAGVAHIGTVEEVSEEDLDRLYSVNVKGAYLCIRAVIGEMKARRSGVIVNLASIAASAGLAQRFAYSMSKGAIRAMTFSVARDYAPFGVRCVSISPARVHTPFVDGYLAKHYPGHEQEMFDKLSALQPIGRMGTPREVAELALYLCSDEAAFATGTDYPLDGGFLRLHG